MGRERLLLRLFVQDKLGLRKLKEGEFAAAVDLFSVPERPLGCVCDPARWDSNHFPICDEFEQYEYWPIYGSGEICVCGHLRECHVEACRALGEA